MRYLGVIIILFSLSLLRTFWASRHEHKDYFGQTARGIMGVILLFILGLILLLKPEAICNEN